MDDELYFTYIVASRSRTLYIGVTSSLQKRMFEHKRKLHEGFTATYNCNRLVWFESYVDPSNAIAREKQLKGWTRVKKIALITKTNPTWIDLSEKWYPREELTGTPSHQ
ncbi:MAG TPA: GIY-YIG nuclease family protein [Terracidiphilus sp.]|nr:GIY-YIG nuclease family protein [Terracidiphilus sp.]